MAAHTESTAAPAGRNMFDRTYTSRRGAVQYTTVRMERGYAVTRRTAAEPTSVELIRIRLFAEFESHELCRNEAARDARLLSQAEEA